MILKESFKRMHQVNSIKADFLLNFLSDALSKKCITSIHIALYIGIYRNYCVNSQANPFFITRRGMMAIAKIKSKATYHKCISDLIREGYITYEPSYNPFTGSTVTLISLRNYAMIKDEEK